MYLNSDSFLLLLLLNSWNSILITHFVFQIYWIHEKSVTFWYSHRRGKSVEQSGSESLIEIRICHFHWASSPKDISTGGWGRVVLCVAIDKGNPVAVVPRRTKLGHGGLHQIGKDAGESQWVAWGLGWSRQELDETSRLTAGQTRAKGTGEGPGRRQRRFSAYDMEN